MKKWEYATVPLMIHTTKAILDNWGEDGWELVTVLPGASAPAGATPHRTWSLRLRATPSPTLSARRLTKSSVPGGHLAIPALL